LNLALDAAIEKVEKKKGINQPEKLKSVTKKDKPIPDENAVKGTTSQGFEVSTQDPGIATHDSRVSTQSFSIKSSRYISRRVRRMVFKRSENQCEQVHPDGQRCVSKFQMQFDHITAFSKNGSAEITNIQHLCRVHNAYKGGK
jgi:hypothetical protein